MSRTFRHIKKAKFKRFDPDTWMNQWTHDIWKLWDSLGFPHPWPHGIPKDDRRMLHKKVRRQTKDALHNRQFTRIPQPRKDKDRW